MSPPWLEHDKFLGLDLAILMEKHLKQQNDDGWDSSPLIDAPPIKGWIPNPEDRDPPKKMGLIVAA